MKKLTLVLSAIFSLNSCSDTSLHRKFLPGKSEEVILDIQPFVGMPVEEVNFVSNELKRIYPHIRINPAIPLPEMAFFQRRSRYRADSLIKFIRAFTPDGHITLGLTHMDISHTNGSIDDFGIMGLAYQPGNACIASTFRLSRKYVRTQLFKTAIHELGHAQGLPHCPVRTCYMRDAEGKNHANEETSFCPECTGYLEAKGWKFRK